MTGGNNSVMPVPVVEAYLYQGTSGYRTGPAVALLLSLSPLGLWGSLGAGLYIFSSTCSMFIP